MKNALKITVKGEEKTVNLEQGEFVGGIAEVMARWIPVFSLAISSHLSSDVMKRPNTRGT